MRYLTDTIAGRAILVLVFGLGATLFVAQYLYQAASERELMASNANRFAERILVLANTITSVDAGARDDTAHRLSGGPLELHWSERPMTIRGGTLDSSAEMLRQMLLERDPGLKSRGLVVGTGGGEGEEAATQIARHTTLISLALEDGSWLNVTLAKVKPTQLAAPSFIVTTLVGVLGIVTLSVLLSRWLTRPLERLADSARTLFIGAGSGSGVEAGGTQEVRTLAAAINDMHGRIGRLMNDRTQMLAAISHDLRTPLTRMRLRADSVSDPEARKAFEIDIGEMEAMIDAALTFLKEEAHEEPMAPVDLSAILQTLADDADDAGHTVVLDLPRRLIVTGRHLALKRALSNIVGNALKYGGAGEVPVRISARLEGGDVVVRVSDKGPGIPEDRIEDMFAPFSRLDSARTPASAGYGLGLTVARSIARSHGGDLTLANRGGGGLVASFRVPAVRSLKAPVAG